MRISPVNNYNRLFSSLPVYNRTYSKNNMANLTGNVLGVKVDISQINLNDYIAIKNGSYSKLMKSYYNMKKEQNETLKKPITIEQIIKEKEDP